MQAAERRAEILEVLRGTKGAVSATQLAARFGVSRQVIVGDVALLRAEGADICATPRGYTCRRAAAACDVAVEITADFPICWKGAL